MINDHVFDISIDCLRDNNVHIPVILTSYTELLRTFHTVIVVQISLIV